MFDRNLYDLFNGGNAYKSVGAQLPSISGNSQQYITDLGLLPTVSPDKTARAITAIENINTVTTDLKAHVDQRMGNLLDDLSVAKAARQIDGVSSCANLNPIMGAINNSDAYASEILSQMGQINNKVNGVNTGLMTVPQFETWLDGLSDYLENKHSELTTLIDTERAELQKIYQQHKAMTNAMRAVEVAEDPCAKAILQQLGSSSLKGKLGI